MFIFINFLKGKEKRREKSSVEKSSTGVQGKWDAFRLLVQKRLTRPGTKAVDIFIFFFVNFRYVLDNIKKNNDN